MKITKISCSLSQKIQLKQFEPFSASFSAEAEVTEKDDLEACYTELKQTVKHELDNAIQTVNAAKNAPVSTGNNNMDNFQRSLGIQDTPEEQERRRIATQKEKTQQHIIQSAMKAKQEKDSFELAENPHYAARKNTQKRAPKKIGSAPQAQKEDDEPLQLITI